MLHAPDVRYAGTVPLPSGEHAPVYVSVERHECNAYCVGGRHAELLYCADSDPLPMAVLQAICELVSPAWAVLDVRPAPELPLPTGIKAAWLITYGLGEATR